MKALNFGSLNLDYIYRIDHFVAAGETLRAKSVRIVSGGKGLNQSLALSRAGVEVFHAGCVGEGGQVLTDILKHNGINTDFITKVDEVQGNAIIQVTDQGENCILINGGSNRCITDEQIDRTLLNFENGDYLMLQNEVNNIDQIINKASMRGMRIFLNPSPFDENLHEIDWSRLTWIIVNEVEASILMRDFLYQEDFDIVQDPQSFFDAVHEKWQDLNVVLTLGPNGAWAFTNRESVFQPALKAKVVDSTAAGDVFSGFFLGSLMKGETLEQSMKYAAKAASICVSRSGAAPSIPFASEVF
ncbi:MAG: ribokinase [Sphaerochaetaceae bacterium]|nr:ribokinase [Sphaerochaetaceae bacterium]